MSVLRFFVVFFLIIVQTFSVKLHIKEHNHTRVP